MLDDNGQPVIENREYVLTDKEAFEKEFAELANIEIVIDIDPIPLDALGNIQMSPYSLVNLEQIIVIPEDKNVVEVSNDK
jgi:hypothetical protein